MAKHETEGPADTLLFSIDQGTCWHEVGLEEAIDVGNIRRAPRPLSISPACALCASARAFLPAGWGCARRRQGPRARGPCTPRPWSWLAAELVHALPLHALVAPQARQLFVT